MVANRSELFTSYHVHVEVRCVLNLQKINVTIIHCLDTITIYDRARCFVGVCILQPKCNPDIAMLCIAGLQHSQPYILQVVILKLDM